MAPVYFWREFEAEVGYLSQWYESTFDHNGITFTTTEMWMMYQKAQLFKDTDTAERILKVSNPRQAQKLGREVKGFDRQLWDQEKSRIVEEGNWHKFSSREDLKALLLATGNRELVEASPTDRIWGIGFNATQAEESRAHWGQNLLGKALENVRARLRAAED